MLQCLYLKDGITDRQLHGNAELGMQYNRQEIEASIAHTICHIDIPPAAAAVDL